MKTATYLRLSLLIPFLVWAFCALALFLWSTFEPNELGSEGSTAFAAIAVFFLYYVFGILVWFLPYLLLCIILLARSFKSRAQVRIKGFALSPFGMALLVLAVVNMLSLHGEDISTIVATRAAFAEDLWGSNVVFLLLTLLWGYLCVGIGYGIYRILRGLEFIRDETIPNSLPLVEPS
jgi:hypothetical protein